jgi:hypothetical protein
MRPPAGAAGAGGQRRGMRYLIFDILDFHHDGRHGGWLGEGRSGATREADEGRVEGGRGSEAQRRWRRREGWRRRSRTGLAAAAAATAAAYSRTGEQTRRRRKVEAERGR